MAATNHPFFFPLLKKLIIVTLRKTNANKITGKDKKIISQISGIKQSYCERILALGVYRSKVGQTPIGEDTLSKLVKCLPHKWGYENWDVFCFQEQKKMKDTQLISDLTDSDFYILSKHHQERIKNEIEHRASLYIQDLQGKDEIQNLKTKLSESLSESKPIQLAKDISDSETKNLSSANQHNIPQHSYSLFSLLVPILLVISIGALFYISQMRTSSNNHDDEIEIERIIRKALQFEFNAYKGVPMDKNCWDTLNYSCMCETPCLEKVRRGYMPYLDSLKEYMGADLITQIRNVVGGSVWKGWTLQNKYNMSNMNVSAIDEIKIITGDSVAYAQTRENCSIQWFDIELGEYVYYYNSPDTYRYTLEKKDGQNWKIMDVEDNTQGRIIRAALICCNLQEGLVNVHTTQESILKALEGKDLNRALKYLQCFHRDNNKPLPDQAHTIYIELKYLYKNLNTHVIKPHEFNQQKIKLVEKFSQWFENYNIASLEL